MPADSGTPRRFQFSLRTFLIVTCATGVAAGLLGRLFFRAPEVFLGISTLLFTAVPFLLAISTIFWIGTRRGPGWSKLICGKCRYDLWPVDPSRVANCPACGANLTESNALLVSGGRGRRWGLVAWGGVLLAMPIVGIGILFVAHHFIGPSPGGLGLLSTQQLIQERLPNQIDEPWVWRELEVRLKAGSLSQQDVDAAIEKLSSHMTATRPQGWDSPLHWQSDFIKSAGQAGPISEPVLFALCDAFYGPKPVLRPLARLREGRSGFSIEIEYGNTWSSQSNLGLQLVWQVNRVLLDGKPFGVRDTHKGAGSWSGYHDGSLEAGDHRLTVEVECAYIDQGKLIGLEPGDLSKSLWPEARKRWTETVSAPLKVFSNDERLVSPVTNPGQHPGAGGGISISRFAVQPDRDGGKAYAVSRFLKGVAVIARYLAEHFQSNGTGCSIVLTRRYSPKSLFHRASSSSGPPRMKYNLPVSDRSSPGEISGQSGRECRHE